MKISISNTAFENDINAIKAISEGTLNHKDIKVISGSYDTYVFVKNANIPIDGNGNPIFDNNVFQANDGAGSKHAWFRNDDVLWKVCGVVDDGYDFVSNNAAEITDIVTVANVGVHLVNDSTPGFRYLRNLRKVLETLVYTKMQIVDFADVNNQANWDLLTAAEKSVAAHWFLVKKDSFAFEVVNDDLYWTQKASDYRQWTNAERKNILYMMEGLVFRRMENLVDAIQVFADMDQIVKETQEFIFDQDNKSTKKIRVKTLARQYVQGLESLAMDGEIALRDYINSETGTPFETNGFRAITYPFKTGHTANSVADELVNMIDMTW